MPATPPRPVSLRSVAGELQLLDDTMTAYLDRRTGEVTIMTEDDVRLAEDDAEPAAEWERAWRETLREGLASGAWLALPGRWELDDYGIMEAFCLSVAPGEGAERLERAVRGRGAFRRFRDAVADLGLEDRWYAHRDRAYARVAADWLGAHGVPFEGGAGE